MTAQHELTDIKGVGQGKAKKLEDAGYNDIISIARSSARVMAEDVTGFKEGSAQNVIDAAREMLREGGSKFKTGTKIEEEQDNIKTITTGSEDLDQLLNGGVATKYTTEAYGKSSTGKTQLCHQLAVNAQLPENAARCPECGRRAVNEEKYLEQECCPDKPEEDDFEDRDEYERKVFRGGTGKGAVFIDTEETFRADRIRQMAEAKGLDPEETLENIHVTRPEDGAEQAQAIKDVMQELDMNEKGIVIVDSIMAHFRAEYSGRGEVGERQDRIGEMLGKLQDIASGYEVAVFYSNQAYDDPGKMFGDPTEATGGNVLKHNSSYRLYLQDRGSKGWAAEIVDSPNLKQEQVRYDIDETGIINAD